MKSIQKSVSSRIRFLLNVMIMSVVFPCLSYGAAYLTSISSNPPTVPSGGIATVTVRVSEACGAGGCTVGLYSQKPSLFPLPSSVTVPEGAASVSIAVQAAVNNTGSGQYFIIQANFFFYTIFFWKFKFVFCNAIFYLIRSIYGTNASF